ncbi:MAG: hypothetical protein ACK5CE_17145 [Actinomycetes bacterium]
MDALIDAVRSVMTEEELQQHLGELLQIARSRVEAELADHLSPAQWAAYRQFQEEPVTKQRSRAANRAARHDGTSPPPLSRDEVILSLPRTRSARSHRRWLDAERRIHSLQPLEVLVFTEPCGFVARIPGHMQSGPWPTAEEAVSDLLTILSSAYGEPAGDPARGITVRHIDTSRPL